MKVAFVDLKAQYLSIKTEIDAAIQNVIMDTAFVGGKYVTKFEQDFAAFIGTKHCIGVGNGTDAIFLALKAAGIGAGDEVITVANTFIATSEAISQTGAQVVFVDCDPATYNMDAEALAKAITGKTRAIVPVHLYGQPAQMDRIMELAGKHGLHVIEDGAQAHGAQYKGRNVGTFGNLACFSFFPGKNLGAYGDGGAIVTNDDALAERARMFANHGRKDKYNHQFEGVNSRLDGLQAAVLGVKLKYLDRWNGRRREIAGRYEEALKGLVVTPSVMPEATHVFHLYVVRITERDRVRQLLEDKGISVGVHYPIPLPFLTAYAALGATAADYPVAASLQNEILSLPIHGSMTDEEVTYVIDELRKILQP